MRNFFRPGELPLVLLSLLAREQHNGYGLLDALDRLFGPTYKPSPGSVYPALVALLKEKLVVKADDRYQLTAAGRSVLQKRADMLASIEVRTGVHLRSEATVITSLERFAAVVRKFDGLVRPDQVDEVLQEAVSKIERLTKEGAG